MLHEPAVELGRDNSIEKKTKLGVKQFWIYFAAYFGFVLIGAISPATLGESLFGSVSLAFFYGMGLIILAAVMGLIYNFFCTRYEDRLNTDNTEVQS